MQDWIIGVRAMGICGIPVVSVITEITELFDVGQVKSGGGVYLGADRFLPAPIVI